MPLFGVKAKVDFKDHQFKAAFISDEWEVDVVDSNADAALAIGVILDKPRAGQPASIAIPGDPIGPSLKGWLGAAASAGALLHPDSDGKLRPTTTDKDRVIAIAMQDGAADDIIQIAPFVMHQVA